MISGMKVWYTGNGKIVAIEYSEASKETKDSI